MIMEYAPKLESDRRDHDWESKKGDDGLQNSMLQKEWEHWITLTLMMKVLESGGNVANMAF